MFLVRGLVLALVAGAVLFDGRAAAAGIVAPLPSGEPQFQFVSGCGIGVRRGPHNDCPRLYPAVPHERYVRRRSYHRKYRKGSHRRYIGSAPPDAVYRHAPLMVGRQCEPGYDLSCLPVICWRRCW